MPSAADLFVVLLLALFVSSISAQSTYVVQALEFSFANCANDTCGIDFPDCQSAEFVSRAIAAGGCIPRLSGTSPKLDFCRYMPDGGTWDGYDTPGAYDLCWTSKENPFGSFNGLYDYLLFAGWRFIGRNASEIDAGCVIFGDEGLGPWTYVCIGVGPDLVDCHNPARCASPASEVMTIATNELLCPPQSCSPTPSSEAIGPTMRTVTSSSSVASSAAYGTSSSSFSYTSSSFFSSSTYASSGRTPIPSSVSYSSSSTSSSAYGSTATSYYSSSSYGYSSSSSGPSLISVGPATTTTTGVATPSPSPSPSISSSSSASSNIRAVLAGPIHTPTPTPGASSSSSTTSPPPPAFFSSSSSITATLPPRTERPTLPPTPKPEFITTGPAPQMTAGPPPLPDDGRSKAIGATFMAVGALTLSFIIAAIITWWISRGEDGLQMTETPEEEELLEEDDEDDIQKRLKEQNSINPLFQQAPGSGENPMYKQLGDS